MISFTINNEDGERREMKFDSFEELSAQIRQDAEAARAYFKKNG